MNGIMEGQHRLSPRTLPLGWLLLFVLPSTGCGPDESVPTQRIVDVSVGTITRGVVAVGRVEPRTRVELKSKANGIIQKLHVDVADVVKAGQVIAELDREILQSRVDEAEAKLAQARAKVELAEAELERLSIEKENPEFEFARTNWQRTEKLFGEGIASEEERDAALERQKKAEYLLRVVTAQHVGAKSTIAAAEGVVREGEALAKLARQELEESTILSPMDGVVLYRYLEEGDAVSSIRVAGGNATVIMTLGDLSELYVDGEVDEIDVGRVMDLQRAGSPLIARVSIESYKERTFSGRVTRVTPLGLEDSNGIVTFEVRIVFDNPERLLLANMTANSLIVLEEKPDVLLVSQGALITDSGKRYVRLYDAATETVARQEVTVGISDGAQVEIADGLERGQKIVLP